MTEVGALNVAVGATLLTVIVKDWVDVPLGVPSLACTVIDRDAGPSTSAPLATVTTPVLALMANRPPASSVRLYITPLPPARPLGSVDEAVIPMAVPFAAPSATLLAVMSLSTGV